MAGVLVLQLRLPSQVSVGPTWLLPALQAALLLPLVVTNPVHLRHDHPLLRVLAVASAAGVMVTNAATLVNLVALLTGGSVLRPAALITSAAVLLVTNVVAVAVLLWELDRGGPFARDPDHARSSGPADLLFPQLVGVPSGDPPGWAPGFVDYLFVAYTMSTAFSPTDTMPLTGRAKLAFMLGASVAMLTFALVAARAVNLL